MKLNSVFVVTVFFQLAFTACFNIPEQHTTALPIKHEEFTKILKQVVCEDGVNYKKLIKNSAELNKYLELLMSHHPDYNTWTRAEIMAYWINAYNAFTLKLVIDNYPLESIKGLSGFFSVPFISSIWDQSWIKIQGYEYSLNDIEQGILRKHFDEPRIHFALNCASISCPSLRSEAYEANILDRQLNEQAVLFLSDTTKNNLGHSAINISRIFFWYSGDFTKKSSLINFLNIFATDSISEDTKIRYKAYNWKLNDIECYLFE